jgi:hypothetical protein
VKRRDHCSVLDLLDELDLVEQEDHAGALVGSRASQLQQQLGEVARDRALVRRAKVDGQLDPVISW